MKELVRLKTRPSRDGNSFVYMLVYVDMEGKIRRQSLSHADKRKAERQRAQKERELRMGLADARSMRLKEFSSDCLERTGSQVRPSTAKEMRNAMRDFITCIGNINLDQVKLAHGERFKTECLDHGVSNGTVAKKIRHLKRMFQLAVQRGQLEKNPIQYLKQPKVSRKKVHVYTDQQCEKLIEAAALFDSTYSRAMPWELVIRVALCTAMRRGEILNLTWRDIDFEDMTVDVEPKVDTAQTWQWLIKDTDRRTVPLTETVVDMLTQWQAEQPEGYPYVFVSPERYRHIQKRRKAGKWTLEHGKCPVNNFYQQFKIIRGRAGVKTGNFHDLRKTCISRWLNSGLEPHEVTEMAGHSCFETTWKFYVSIRKNVLNKAREISNFCARLARAPKKSD